jgi:1-acyl-sn-glycerol-3-phosphate acyltransferase
MRLVRALTTILLLCLNTILLGTPIFLGGIVRFFTPDGPRRRRVILFIAGLAEAWVGNNDRILDAMVDTKWDVEGIGNLRYEGHYLITSNHVSWVDIIVLFRVFHGHAAIPRFFLKQQLIWMPIIGQACWALEFPFMKRYSAEYLAKHPEKRGTDLETTRRACQRYRHVPVAVINFMEGTRFTPEKHAQQESPYRHLLRPRTGGIGFVLASLGDQLDALFDVTIAYPDGRVTFWDLVANRMPRIAVRARRIDIPPELIDSAVTEPGPARDRLKTWVEAMWRDKDRLLDELLTPS